MASVVTHGVVAVALGKTMYSGRMPARFWVLAIGCSMLPDADAIGFWLGVPYGHVFGHRGLTHSFVFGAAVGALVPLLFFRDKRLFSRPWWRLAVFFFVITASHGILDAVTNGGLGIAFFAPFDNGRYFLPWRPVQVSPIGISAFFSEWGFRVILSEILWIWVPVITAALSWRVFRFRRLNPGPERDKPES